MKKYYLILDSSDETLTIGLMDDNNIIYSSCLLQDKKHSELEIISIKKFLLINNINFCDLKGIVVTTSPGSFVGIRISLTIAKIFSFVLNIPIFTISTLLANSIVNNNSIVLLNAGNNKSYIGVFDKNKQELENKIINNIEINEYINKYKTFKIVCKTDYLEQIIGKKIVKSNLLYNINFLFKTGFFCF